MAVSAFSASQDRAIAAINITPLVDVMLVLLIIFMVAAPTLSHRIGLDLPQHVPGVPAPPPATLRLAIDAAGSIAWNGAPQTLSSLPVLMAAEVPRDGSVPQPLLQIDASGDADYEVVARVLAAARNAGLARIAFVRAE